MSNDGKESGNVLLKLTDRGLRVYRLENYVIKRDPQGAVLKIIIKESLNPATLPEKIRKAVLENNDDFKNIDNWLQNLTVSLTSDTMIKLTKKVSFFPN